MEDGGIGGLIGRLVDGYMGAQRRGRLDGWWVDDRKGDGDEGVDRWVDEWVEVAEGGWMVSRRWMDAMKR